MRAANRRHYMKEGETSGHRKRPYIHMVLLLVSPSCRETPVIGSPFIVLFIHKNAT